MGVNGQSEWEQFLKEHEWIFVKFCTCGGTPKYKWEKANYELHILSSRRLFRLFEKGQTKSGGPLGHQSGDMKVKIESL